MRSNELAASWRSGAPRAAMHSMGARAGAFLSTNGAGRWAAMISVTTLTVLTAPRHNAVAQGFSVVSPGDSRPTRPRQSVTIGTTGGAQSDTSATVTSGSISWRDRGQGIRPTVEPHHPWEYGGVTPGAAGGIPRWWTRAVRANARRGGRTVVAWPGFQMTPNGSRLFLAVSATPEITPTRTAGRIVYRLRNAVVPVYNNQRALETAAFETPISRAYLRNRGRDVDLVIEMRASQEPRMTDNGVADGLRFIYFDFGTWTPPSEPSSGTPAASNPASDPQPRRTSGAPPATTTNSGVRPSQVADDETPPAVQR